MTMHVYVVYHYTSSMLIHVALVMYHQHHQQVCSMWCITTQAATTYCILVGVVVVGVVDTRCMYSGVSLHKQLPCYSEDRRLQLPPAPLLCTYIWILYTYISISVYILYMYIFCIDFFFDIYIEYICISHTCSIYAYRIYMSRIADSRYISYL